MARILLLLALSACGRATEAPTPSDDGPPVEPTRVPAANLEYPSVTQVHGVTLVQQSEHPDSTFIAVAFPTDTDPALRTLWIGQKIEIMQSLADSDAFVTTQRSHELVTFRINSAPRTMDNALQTVLQIIGNPPAEDASAALQELSSSIATRSHLFVASSSWSMNTIVETVTASWPDGAPLRTEYNAEKLAIGILTNHRLGVEPGQAITEAELSQVRTDAKNEIVYAATTPIEGAAYQADVWRSACTLDAVYAAIDSATPKQ